MTNVIRIKGVNYELESYSQFPDGSVSATLLPSKKQDTKKRKK